MPPAKEPVAGWNPAIPQGSSKPRRLRRWWIAGITCWLTTAAFAELIAQAVDALPQPNQTQWVVALALSPCVPLLLVVLGTSARARLRDRRVWRGAGVPKLLFWTSMALLVLVAPKPP